MQIKTAPDQSVKVFSGDTTLQAIGDGANVTVKDGNLTVLGTVGPNVRIKLIHTKANVLNHSVTNNPNINTGIEIDCCCFFFRRGGGSDHNLITPTYMLTILGDVHTKSDLQWFGPVKLSGHLHKKVRVKSSCASIEFNTADDHVVIESSNGRITGNKTANFCQLLTNNGSINVSTIGHNCIVRTSNAKICIDTTDNNCQLNTSNGAITVNIVGANSILSTSNGKIRAQQADPSVKAKTSNASVKLRK